MSGRLSVGQDGFEPNRGKQGYLSSLLSWRSAGESTGAEAFSFSRLRCSGKGLTNQAQE